jgi:hypothetical protein
MMANVCEDRAAAFGSFDGYVGDATKQSFTIRLGWCGKAMRDTANIDAVVFLILMTVLAARVVHFVP